MQTHSHTHRNMPARAKFAIWYVKTMDHVYEFIEPNSVVRKQVTRIQNTRGLCDMDIFLFYYVVVCWMCLLGHNTRKVVDRNNVSNAKYLNLWHLCLNYAFCTCFFRPFKHKIVPIVRDFEGRKSWIETNEFFFADKPNEMKKIYEFPF